VFRVVRPHLSIHRPSLTAFGTCQLPGLLSAASLLTTLRLRWPLFAPLLLFAHSFWGGGGGGGGTIAEIAGATSLKNLTDRLLGVQTKITDLTFQTITGGISKSSAQKQLNKLTAEFDVLTNQANALVAQQPVGSPFGQAGGNTTNIYVSGAVVDPEGLNRVLTDVQNQSNARGTFVGTAFGQA
jgi:hypothetical protein